MQPAWRQRAVRGSIAATLRQRLPQLTDDLTLATALQALWRGWLLGTATPSDSDARQFARSIEWLITGATTGRRQHIEGEQQSR
jgi:hypothetical protein